MATQSKRPFKYIPREPQGNLGTDAPALVDDSDHQSAQALSQSEIGARVGSVAQLLPAGDIPRLILSGFARLRGKNTAEPTERSRARRRDQLIYAIVFALPAFLIWVYQTVLRLAGKKLAAAFPDGTWQFYVDYALRDDTARHTNETHGFDTALRHQGIVLDDVDRMTAWTMTAIQTLHQYDALLKNEWRERVYSRALVELSDDPTHRERYADVFRIWQRDYLPYRRRADARSNETYSAYRHRKFNEYFINHLTALQPEQQRAWRADINTLKDRDLNAYQHQMSILSFLVSDVHGELHKRLPLQQAHVALFYRGRYYMVPACKEETNQMPNMETVRQQIAAIVFHGAAEGVGSGLVDFAAIQRSQWPASRKKLPPQFVKELDMLRLAPIVLNFDPQPYNLSLSKLRQAERGIGDHALTIFDTRKTFVFDQSHIFFDGAWGAALAEIMTNEAIAWTRLLKLGQPGRPGNQRPYSPSYHLTAEQQQRLSRLKIRCVKPETGAENAGVDLYAMQTLRDAFAARSHLLDLTVNDLMILYRAIHAVTYQPDDTLIDALRELQKERKTRKAATTALAELEARASSPAILLPVDASPYNPRHRIYPISFEVPLAELKLLDLHRYALSTLESDDFEIAQHQYLTALAGFGQVMRRAKAIARTGESASVQTIKLLAYMPTPMQRFLDGIPERFEVLNDLIKGREVFSNIGQVAPTSTLTRFITAKDDNEKKSLVWAVITDAEQHLNISLRDFRPHVGQLIEVGQEELAQRLTQHYLDSYVYGLNRYIEALLCIMRAASDTCTEIQEVL